MFSYDMNHKGPSETLKDTQEEIIANGCLHDFNDGEFRHNVPSTFGIKMLCREIFNPFWDAKALDGLPIGFSEPLHGGPTFDPVGRCSHVTLMHEKTLLIIGGQNIIFSVFYFLTSTKK